MGIFKLNGVDYMGGGGGGNANEQVLTWAEYCALTEEEKNNGTTYYIDDINGEGKDQFQPIIYSEEEREIGVWINGKPLYEKTINFGAIPNNTTKSVAHNISNLEKVVFFSGVMLSSTSSETLPSGENSNFRLQANNTNINVITSTSWNSWTDSYITIRYTKTTDSSGSGTWTPQGVPAVHYSTDEQVVGTWADGKTVYEQTIIGNAISDTGINVLWERTDIDTVVEYNCIFLDGDNLEYNANYYYSTGAYFRVFVDTQSIWTNTKGIVCQRSSNQAINGTRLTVRYTKSTS